MPNYWTRFSIKTAPPLRGKKPSELKREVHKIVSRNGAGLDEVFFAPDAGVAYALIHVPGDRKVDVEGIVAELEGQDTIKLLTAEEVEG